MSESISHGSVANAHTTSNENITEFASIVNMDSAASPFYKNLGEVSLDAQN
jgi:hypothetical protein